MLTTYESASAGPAFLKIVDAVRARGFRVKETGPNTARAQCPAHQGQGLNLSLFSTESRVNAVCHSRGCDFAEILAAVGLTIADRYHHSKTCYRYDDGRTVTRTAGKRFFQAGNTSGQPTLYRSRKVAAAVAEGVRVLLVEGEEDVLAAEAIGAVATAAPMGARNFGKVDASPLRGADVVAVMDRDEQGQEWATQVRATVGPVARSLRFVEAAAGKDLSDHLAAEHTLAQLVDVQDDPHSSPSTPTVVTLDAVIPERVRWLWAGRLPQGKLVVLDGDPSTGKSTLTLDLAAHVSQGHPWPDGTPCPTGDVLLLSAEDGLADTIAPRLLAAGADTSRVHALTEVPIVGDYGAVKMAPPTLPRDLSHIATVLRRHKIKLIIIDVLMAFLDGQVDSHRDQDVRGVLHQLARMAETSGCTIVLVRHLNKAGGSNALYRGGGSIGIVGSARAAFLVARDPEDETRRVLAPTKCNLAAEPPALAYRLVDCPDRGCARVEWEAGPVNVTARQLLANADSNPDESHAVDIWLSDLLTTGPMRATEIYQAADAAGFSKDQAKRAKKRLNVTAEKQGMTQGWTWSLPDEEAKGAKSASKPSPLPSHSSPLPSQNDVTLTALPEACPECGGRLDRKSKVAACGYRHVGHFHNQDGDE